MQQSNELTPEFLNSLLKAMKTSKKPAIIDWSNHTIMILGDVEIHQLIKIMSNGQPMTFQRYLFKERFK